MIGDKTKKLRDIVTKAGYIQTQYTLCEHLAEIGELKAAGFSYTVELARRWWMLTCSYKGFMGAEHA